MLRLSCAIACGMVGLFLAVSPANAAEALSLNGAVLKLSETSDKPFTVNTGALVIVIVRDSGSRPPQNIKVDAPRAFQPLGVVRGTQTDQGQALMGGGYTWYLFTPVTAGDASVKVNYTENGDGGKKVERVYKVKINKDA